MTAALQTVIGPDVACQVRCVKSIEPPPGQHKVPLVQSMVRAEYDERTAEELIGREGCSRQHAHGKRGHGIHAEYDQRIWDILACVLRGYGQLFLTNNVFSGLLYCVGLFAASPMHGVLSLAVARSRRRPACG